MKLIGIDPDTTLSGVATFTDSTIQKLELKTLFPLLEYIRDSRADMVCISAGWKNKVVNFQNRDVDEKVRERISERVGANHEIGRQIEAFCNSEGIPYTLVVPRSKKVNASVFAALTGYSQRTNQEHRDAAMCVIAYLNKKK